MRILLWHGYLLGGTGSNVYTRALAREWQVTVLLVEHDMEVVFGISDRITVLHLGKVLAEGEPDAIRSNPVVVSAYLGSTAQ